MHVYVESGLVCVKSTWFDLPVRCKCISCHIQWVGLCNVLYM